MHDKILDKINTEIKNGNKVAFATLTEVKGSSQEKLELYLLILMIKV